MRYRFRVGLIHGFRSVKRLSKQELGMLLDKIGYSEIKEQFKDRRAKKEDYFNFIKKVYRQEPVKVFSGLLKVIPDPETLINASSLGDESKRELDKLEKIINKIGTTVRDRDLADFLEDMEVYAREHKLDEVKAVPIRVEAKEEKKSDGSSSDERKTESDGYESSAEETDEEDEDGGGYIEGMLDGIGTGEMTYGYELEQMLNKYKNFMGLCARDEIPELLRGRYGKFGFIYHTKNEDHSQKHWRAIYIDTNDGGEISHYCSYGDIEDDILKYLKDYAKDTPLKLKLKINRNAEQLDRSLRCGLFCVNYLMKRFEGKNFMEATNTGEAQAKELQEKFNIFGYI